MTLYSAPLPTPAPAGLATWGATWASQRADRYSPGSTHPSTPRGYTRPYTPLAHHTEHATHRPYSSFETLVVDPRGSNAHRGTHH